jgi:dihydroorotase
MSKIDNLKILLEEAKYDWVNIRKELSPVIDKLVQDFILTLKDEANDIKIDVPYKEQYLLEEVIKSLQERV